MEGSVHLNDFIHVAICHMLTDFVQIAVHAFQLLIGDALSGEAGCQHIQAGAYLVNFGDILNGNIGYIGAATWNHHHEALQLQLADGLAYGSTADAHLVGQLDFHQAFAGTKGAVNNGLAYIFTNQLAQGLVAVKFYRLQMSTHISKSSPRL